MLGMRPACDCDAAGRSVRQQDRRQLRADAAVAKPGRGGRDVSRSFLQVVSLLLAQATGAVLAYGYRWIDYLQALARARSFRPGVGLCGHDYFVTAILAMALAATLAALLVAVFWRCYDGLPEVRSKREPQS